MTKRLMITDIDSLNILTILRWLCRLMFALGFGMTFAVVLIFARWSLETKKADQTVEYTVIRLQAENSQLRDAIGELQKQLRPVKGGNKISVGGQ